MKNDPCTITLTGEMSCPSSHMLYKSMSVVLSPTTRAADLEAAIKQLPEHAEVIQLVDFGVDGWVLLYKVPQAVSAQ